MTTFVLPADAVHESAALCDYLVDRLDSDDIVHAVSTAIEANSPQARRDSEDAQNAIYARLGAIATVERHTETAESQPAALRSVAERTTADEIIVSNVAAEADKYDISHLFENAMCSVVVVAGAVS